MLQYAEGLTGRQPTDQVRANRLEVPPRLGTGESGFDFSVLSDFHARLIEHGPKSTSWTWFWPGAPNSGCCVQAVSSAPTPPTRASSPRWSVQLTVGTISLTDAQ
ncbi:hypothetical protein [Streptomyces sp. NBC_01717]|uniref:hypothetical protein n=1 Tax=Streptomyces sp. NBC_01717 TaxID=2975918 RepID=UPI003FCD5A08